MCSRSAQCYYRRWAEALRLNAARGASKVCDGLGHVCRFDVEVVPGVSVRSRLRLGVPTLEGSSKALMARVGTLGVQSYRGAPLLRKFLHDLRFPVSEVDEFFVEANTWPAMLVPW